MSDLDCFDGNIWDDACLSKSLDWMEADERTMENYAQDIDKRVETLQGRIRGYFTRRQYIVGQARKIETAGTTAMSTISNILQKSSGNQKRLTTAVPQEIVTNNLTSDFRPTNNNDLASALEDIDEMLAQRQADEMPHGWLLQPQGDNIRLRFLDLKSRTETTKHPRQGDAHLVYGEWFNIMTEWQQYEDQDDFNSATVPTIGELALQACAKQCRIIQNRDGPAIASWWIRDPRPDVDCPLCVLCRHIDLSKLVKLSWAGQVILKPLHLICMETECVFCRLIARSTTTVSLDNAKLPGSVQCVLNSTKSNEIQVQFIARTGITVVASVLKLPGTGEIQDVGVACLGDQMDLALVKSWLLDCDTLHCKGAEQKDWEEKACISSFVNLSSQTDITVVDIRHSCLVEIAMGSRYVALSYTWGGDQPFKNDRAHNSALHQPGALQKYWNAIPRTIQDAVTFTKLIGIEYLWVDSLCIIQDDAYHKMRQIANMANVYSSAYLTIVAAHGSTCHSGLPGVFSTVRTEQAATEIQGMKLICRLPGYQDAVETSVWNSRGWTYQEAELSARHVIFTEHQVFYRCNRRICSEQFGMRNLENARSYVYGIQLTYQPNFLSYHDAVRNYTKRHLGEENDIENAFQGMTALMQPMFNCGFVHCLPETELDLALLWQPYTAVFKRRARHQNGGKNFPSWSWTGWAGPCRYFMWSDHLLDDVSRVSWIDAETEELFTSDKSRAPQGGPVFRPNDIIVEKRNDGWRPKRFGSQNQYDILAWYHEREPRRWLMHPTASISERASRVFVKPGSCELRFRALVSFFRLTRATEFIANKSPDLLPAGILDRDGFQAGIMWIHRGLPIAKDVFVFSSQADKVEKCGLYELVCLSRRHGSSWESYKNTIYEERPYAIPQSADDLGDMSDQRTVYPVAKPFDRTGDDGVDPRRYNVHKPFPLYNVMLISRMDGDNDGLAERVAVGTIHTTAFLQASPEWKVIRLV